MDYSKMKLGMIDKIKVWNQRRIAEARRNQYYKDEGELLEVDYSEADKLEMDLLEQKRIKKATKDAAKLYKQSYGKNNDGVGESDFIEDYLIENGLKQKALPSPQISRRQEFISQYPTEKSDAELAYEQANTKPEMYYKIEGVLYKIPSIYQHLYLEKIKNGELSIPLEDKGNNRYVILDDKMAPEDKYSMLNRIIDVSLSQIGEEVYAITEDLPESELRDTFPALCRKASYIDYVSKKLYSEGKVEDANVKLEKIISRTLKFHQDMYKAFEDEKTY